MLSEGKQPVLITKQFATLVDLCKSFRGRRLKIVRWRATGKRSFTSQASSLLLWNPSQRMWKQIHLKLQIVIQFIIISAWRRATGMRAKPEAWSHCHPWLIGAQSLFAIYGSAKSENYKSIGNSVSQSPITNWRFFAAGQFFAINSLSEKWHKMLHIATEKVTTIKKKRCSIWIIHSRRRKECKRKAAGIVETQVESARRLMYLSTSRHCGLIQFNKLVEYL